MRWARAVLVVLPLLAACNRPRLSAAGTVVPDAALRAPSLPDDIPGFAAGPMTTAGGALHRSYTRAGSQVTVTLAHFAMDAAQYEGWVRTSTAGFPQATLDVPAGAGNGFYQCDQQAPPRCSLLVQLRSGVHLELRGGPASREDLDAVARGLPLRALAGGPFPP
jgi:hypothetical protein